MKTDTHARIAYIVGRLISGKSIVSLYDYASSEHIEVKDLSDIKSLKEFDYFQWSYMAGSGKRSAKFRYSSNDGGFIDLAIRGNTFIGYIQESASHFMGTVRGDSVYIFDQKEAAHFNFRICGPAVETE